MVIPFTWRVIVVWSIFNPRLIAVLSAGYSTALLFVCQLSTALHVQSTGSQKINEVNQQMARFVLRWVTTFSNCVLLWRDWASGRLRAGRNWANSYVKYRNIYECIIAVLNFKSSTGQGMCNLLTTQLKNKFIKAGWLKFSRTGKILTAYIFTAFPISVGLCAFTFFVRVVLSRWLV